MKAKLNTDALRGFLGTAIQIWLPLFYSIGWIHGDPQTLAGISAGLIFMVNGVFSVFKAEPPPAPPPLPLPANEPMHQGGLPAQVERTNPQ